MNKKLRRTEIRPSQSSRLFKTQEKFSGSFKLTDCKEVFHSNIAHRWRTKSVVYFSLVDIDIAAASLCSTIGQATPCFGEFVVFLVNDDMLWNHMMNDVKWNDLWLVTLSGRLSGRAFKWHALRQLLLPRMVVGVRAGADVTVEDTEKELRNRKPNHKAEVGLLVAKSGRGKGKKSQTPSTVPLLQDSCPWVLV